VSNTFLVVYAPNTKLIDKKDGSADKAYTSATDLTTDSGINSADFEGKDVGLFSLFVPFVKNYASSMSKTKVRILYTCYNSTLFTLFLEPCQTSLPYLLLSSPIIVNAHGESSDEPH